MTTEETVSALQSEIEARLQEAEPKVEVLLVEVVSGHTLRLYRLLQHASSVVGLLLVAWALWRWTHGEVRPGPAGADPDGGQPRAEMDAWERHAWFAAYLLIPAAALLAFLASFSGHPHPVIVSGRFLTRLAFVGLSGVGLSLLLVSALVRLRVALGLRPLDP